MNSQPFFKKNLFESSVSLVHFYYAYTPVPLTKLQLWVPPTKKIFTTFVDFREKKKI